MTLFRSKKPEPMTVYTDVSEGLKQIYKTQLLPIEKGIYIVLFGCIYKTQCPSQWCAQGFANGV